MTFYVVHTRISCVATSVCAQTRFCSKKRAMTREGVNLDMKLPSTFREVFKYEKIHICAKEWPWKLQVDSPHLSFMSRSTPSLVIARFLLRSLVCAQTLMAACELRRRSSRHPSPTLPRVTFSTCFSCLQVLDMSQTPNNSHSIPCGTFIGLVLTLI